MMPTGLLPPQEELLKALVEAARAHPAAPRQPYIALLSLSSTGDIIHPTLGRGLHAYFDDVQALGHAGLLQVTTQDTTQIVFNLNAATFELYARLELEGREPVDRIGDQLHRYLSSDSFRRRHPGAFEAWKQGEELLWTIGDDGIGFTDVGHHCWQASIAFASDIAKGTSAESLGSELTKVRVKAALDAAQPGQRTQALAASLVDLWSAAQDLVQRQRHGAAKSGDPITWQDARRVVLYTGLCMLEIDELLTESP